MNNITVEGNLTRDAEMKYSKNNKAILNFCVASEDGSGDYKKTSFFDCTIFDKFAEAMKPYLVKGAKVVCAGEMDQRRWETKDGEKRTAWGVKVERLHLIGGKKTQGDGQPPADDANTAVVPDVEDPFSDM